MPTYAIGDIQGCYQELLDLLDRINFDERNDRLWFSGDLVNRGPDSLATLRLVRRLKAVTVTGNHECHLLAIAAGIGNQGKSDTLDEILGAADRDELLTWIRQFPFLHSDADSGYTMVHAGLPPQWDLQQAIAMSEEAGAIFKGDDFRHFLPNMYGNRPDIWDDRLTGWDRLRFIVNAFTRTRYCSEEGRLNFSDKGPPGSQPDRFHPWFRIPFRRTRNDPIIFGHWASVHHGNLRHFESDNVYPVDTGCVWGRELTALRLEDKRFFSVPSRQQVAG